MGDLSVSEAAPVGPTLQRITAPNNPCVDSGHNERTDPAVEVPTMPDPHQVALVAHLRLGRAIRAKSVRVIDEPAAFRVGANLFELEFDCGQRPAAKPALKRLYQQRGVLQVAGAICCGCPVQQQYPEVGGDRV